MYMLAKFITLAEMIITIRKKVVLIKSTITGRFKVTELVEVTHNSKSNLFFLRPR